MSIFIGRSITLPDGSRAIPLTCEHCRARVEFVTPVALKEFAALARAFEDRHAECLLDARERGTHTGSCPDPACEQCLTAGAL